MNIQIVEVPCTHPDFITLARRLDEDLNSRYGALQAQYNAYNALSGLETVLLLYAGGLPAACGAFKRYDDGTAEIKRLFVFPKYRGHGFAKKLLGCLEQRAADRGFCRAVLETGVRQTEAIGLYIKCGYEATDNYGQYIGNPNSVCMRKTLPLSEK